MKQLQKRNKWPLGAVGAFLLGFALASMIQAQPAAALDLGDLLKGALKIGGIKLAIDQFGGDINKSINKLLDNNDASVDASTKVVPIISVIGNKHIGAAQVVGPKEAVDRVEAVAQLEQDFFNKLFRVRAMVPIEGSNIKELHRVKGVAVSAMIDIKL